LDDKGERARKRRFPPTVERERERERERNRKENPERSALRLLAACILPTSPQGGASALSEAGGN